MTTATLSSPTLAQLTFTWDLASAEEDAAIVADCPIVAESPIVAECPCPSAPVVENDEPPVNSLHEALIGDRIGRPFRLGSVMFRLLKSYGITDEEIAAGVDAYHAKRARLQ